MGSQRHKGRHQAGLNQKEEQKWRQSPGQCGSVGASSRKPKGCGFNSQSGRIQEATNRCLSLALTSVSLSLSFPPPLSKPVSTSSGEDGVAELTPAPSQGPPETSAEEGARGIRDSLTSHVSRKSVSEGITLPLASSGKKSLPDCHYNQTQMISTALRSCAGGLHLQKPSFKNTLNYKSWRRL